MILPRFSSNCQRGESRELVFLIAIGYTMVYGILRLIKLRPRDVFMLGGYAAST